MSKSYETAELIEPKNQLILKTGTGGLSQSQLDSIQSRVEAMDIDVQPFLKDTIENLKTIIQSDTFVQGSDDKLMHNFLSDVIAFNVHVKLTNNKGLAIVSGSMLSFVEKNDDMNVDAYHVIKAHINAIDIMMKQNITDTRQDVITAFVKELNDACDRYNSKYNGKLSGI